MDVCWSQNEWLQTASVLHFRSGWILQFQGKEGGMVQPELDGTIWSGAMQTKYYHYDNLPSIMPVLTTAS